MFSSKPNQLCCRVFTLGRGGVKLALVDVFEVVPVLECAAR